MRSFAFAAALLLAAAAPAAATWSIVVADTETQEVGVGAATCLTNFDLKAVLPVIAVGVGAGAAQSAVDGSGSRRNIMLTGLLAGDSSSDIMADVILEPGSASHQNGLADAGGDAATFTGASTFAHASGVTGTFDNVHYAIQGNILTGAPVVAQAELALLNTPGQLPEKLMAAMEAARAMGGDGRCSCPGSVTGCGSPPPAFTKSAHIGHMTFARYGDTDDANCDANGCADGDYYLDLNVANQGSAAADPVFQLRILFDTWRAGLLDRPDAVASTVAYQPLGGSTELTLSLIDWQGSALTSGVNSVTVAHAPGSAGVSTIGAVQDQGDGTYTVLLTAVGGSGTDLFEITIDDGIRPVILPPKRTALEVGLAVFADGFESGSTTSWSGAVP